MIAAVRVSMGLDELSWWTVGAFVLGMVTYRVIAWGVARWRR